MSTYFVISSYAGDLSTAFCRGCHSSRKVAKAQAAHLESTLSNKVVVRVFNARKVPKSVTIYA